MANKELKNFYTLRDMNGMYVMNVIFVRKRRMKDSHWMLGSGPELCFHEISAINDIVTRAIQGGLGADLDRCYIQAYKEVAPQPDYASAVKLKNIRDRIERKMIISKLKGTPVD